MNESPHIVVSGPASPETLGVLRNVAASVGARAALPFDRLDELRIAVDEAATLLLGTGTARLSLDIDPSPAAALRVRLRSDDPVEGWPGDRSTSWGWRVVSELTDEASMRVVDRRAEVTFAFPREPSDG
jgi:serine/threonine-protein kinase RsbW